MNDGINNVDWFVMRTRSKQENVVERCLIQKTISAYLPKRNIIRQWSDRKKSIESPLFPGYIFVLPRPNQLGDLAYIPASCGLVMCGQRPGIIRNREIESIRKVLGSGNPVDVHPGLVAGRRVKVTAGPLAGIIGVLIRVKSQERLVLNAEILGQSVSLEINGTEVVPM